MTRGPQKVIRIEIATAIGCLVLGTICRFGSHTLREIAIVLFGWAAGCAFHLLWMFITGQLPPRS
jgi:hypothetical protein